MATQPIPPTVTWCPPGTYGYSHGGYRPQFDRCAWDNRRARAVSAESHLSFNDFGSMHIQRRAQQMTRRLENPSWALADRQLGMAALKYVERRLFLKHAEFLTLRERLARVSYAARWAMLPLRKSLKKLLFLYHEWATDGQHRAAQLRRLETQCHNTESTILLLQRDVLAVTVGVVFLYYRCSWNSAEIATQLDLQAPHVRQMLARVRIVNENPV
jgi:hypothetical protein